MIRSLSLAMLMLVLTAASTTAQMAGQTQPSVQPAASLGQPAGPVAPRLGAAMPEGGSQVPSLPREAGERSFGRTALLSSIGSFAGLFGGGLIGFGLSGGQLTEGAAVMTFSGSIVGATWAGAATSTRGGQAFLGSLLGSAAGIAFLASAEPQGLAGVLSYSLIQGITTAVATSF